MTKTIYMVCGVPGSGKTWVCKQLKDQYTYVPHDDHIDGSLTQALRKASHTSDKPLVTECPFGERPLKAKLELMGFDVRPVFIVEDKRVIIERYRGRTGGRLQKSAESRISGIKARAQNWNSFFGTSSEILAYLKSR